MDDSPSGGIAEGPGSRNFCMLFRLRNGVRGFLEEEVSLSLLLAAVLVSTPAALPADGSWLTDYGKALARAKSQDKPVLVVLCETADHAVPVRFEKKDRLTDAFVLVFADKNTPAGQHLFDLFEVQGGQCYVVIEREQEWQYCRYDRRLSSSEFETLLKKAAKAKGKPDVDPLEPVAARTGNDDGVFSGGSTLQCFS